MEQYIIKGGNPLVGDVTIGGAKNAALGILAASIMTDEDVLIDNLPDVRDINVMLEAIQEINGMGDHCSALNLHICSQRPEALNMLVNGAASDIAASGKRNLSALVFS